MRISRRSWLRGTEAAIALPWLDSASPLMAKDRFFGQCFRRLVLIRFACQASWLGNDYLSKPIDAAKLVQLVKQLTAARK